MNMADIFWEVCADNVDMLYDYLDSEEVKKALSFYPQVLGKVKLFISNATKALYAIQGAKIMRESDEQDERDTKILMFQGWQEKALMHGGGV